MKPEELMIGDWVYNTHHEKNICITPYDFFVHGHDENGDQYLNCSCKPCFGRDLEPIPLTPEILEKNGFALIDEKEKMYRLNFAEDESVCVTADFKCEEPFVHVRNTCYQATPYCRYVHQLQHALRLCGIEKEIEL
jgi:hypothetical protein